MSNPSHSPIIITILYIYVLYSFMPIVAFYIPSVIRIILALIIWGYFIIPHFSFRWFPLILFPILTIFEYSIDAPSRIISHIYYIINLGTLAALFCAIVDNRDTILARKLVGLLCLAFIINAITTYYGNIRFPNASRLLASVTFAAENYATFQKYNIGGFDVIYSLALATPLSAIWFKMAPRGKRILPLLMMVLFLAAIVESQYTTALVCALVSLILLFVPLRTKPIYLVIFVFIPLLVFVFISDSSSLFSAISSLSGSESVNERMTDISSFLQGDQLDDNSDIIGRYEKYRLSIKGFLSSPLIGGIASGKRMIGGHSFILDTPAKFGIIGLLVLILMYITLYKKYIFVYNQEPFFHFAEIIYFEYIILTLLNPQPFIPFISFAFPLVLYYLSCSPYSCS